MLLHLIFDSVSYLDLDLHKKQGHCHIQSTYKSVMSFPNRFVARYKKLILLPNRRRIGRRLEMGTLWLLAEELCLGN